MTNMTDLGEIFKLVKTPWLAVALANYISEIGAMETGVRNVPIESWMIFFTICSILIFLVHLAGKKHR